MLVVRPAKTNDVKAIRALVDSYAAPGQMLAKETVTLYESVQEFMVAEVDAVVVGTDVSGFYGGRNFVDQ